MVHYSPPILAHLIEISIRSLSSLTSGSANGGVSASAGYPFERDSERRRMQFVEFSFYHQCQWNDEAMTAPLYLKLVGNSNLNPIRPILLLPAPTALLVSSQLMVLCQLQPHLQITRTTSFRRVSNAKLPVYHHCTPKEIVLVSTTASNEKPNASGLTPDQTRALPERCVDPDGPEASIIRSLRKLYSCKAQSVRLRRPRPLSAFRL